MNRMYFSLNYTLLNRFVNTNLLAWNGSKLLPSLCQDKEETNKHQYPQYSMLENTKTEKVVRNFPKQGDK